MIDLSPLWISLRIATVATAITFVLGIAAAYGMHRYRGRWRSLLDGLFLAPMVLPPTVLGFLLLMLLGQNGPIGAFLRRAGINLVFTWYAAVVATTVVAFPLMYKTVLGALKQIDGSLLQAARTLGASELRVFWQIILPLASPGILAGTTLAFARALGEFGATLMLAGNIPGKTQTIPMAIYFAVEAGAFGEATTWTGIILAIALGGLFLANAWQKRSRSPRRRYRQHQAATGGDHAFPNVFSSQSTATKPVSLSVTLVKHLPDFSLNVSFSTDNQPLGLLGASGAGKSLILRCIAGMETPDEGRIVLNGRVLFDSKLGINVPSRDRRVGVVFQNNALFPHLTVADNIAFGLPKSLSGPQRRQIAEQQLAAVQLQGMGDRYPAALSGGQQQRVAMARALSSQPEVLLLDEPFSALDTHLRYRMERELKLRLERFAGIAIFVTHNIEETYRICHKLLVMDRGRISIHDSKFTVLSYPQTVSAARLTGCKNISRAIAVDSATVHALDWNCLVTVTEPIPQNLTHIGIRAHQIGFLEAIGQKAAISLSQSEALYPPNAKQTNSESIGSQQGQATQAQSELRPVVASVSNTFLCWLAAISETPHRKTLSLKLNSPPAHSEDYQLQAEVFRDKGELLIGMPLPWTLALDPRRLMMLSER
ncbi:MAG: molybdate ABC transporter permease subunit [Cyanobacteria bacterium P01_E01_bin.34]